ncbi:MAG: hypothetical protein GYB68_07450 [Chloroflexi bacterium]|nr:hypothetical protein [Chloroflexota bacterium]
MDVKAGMTMAEFVAFAGQAQNQDRSLELIDGDVVETLPNDEHSHIASVLTDQPVLRDAVGWALQPPESSRVAKRERYA